MSPASTLQAQFCPATRLLRPARTIELTAALQPSVFERQRLVADAAASKWSVAALQGHRPLRSHRRPAFGIQLLGWDGAAFVRASGKCR